MSKSQRPTPRKPVTKFAHLQKKMQKQKVQAKRPKKGVQNQGKTPPGTKPPGIAAGFEIGSKKK